MAYTPSLSDISVNKDSGYKPSLSDILSQKPADNRSEFSKAKDGVKEFGKDIGQYYKGVGQGLVNTGINAVNSLKEGGQQFNYAAGGVPQNLINPLHSNQNIPNAQYTDPNSMAGKAGNFAGNVAGAAIPFAGPMARAPLAMQMGAGAAFGASQNPDSRGFGAVMGSVPILAAEKLVSPAINAVARDGFGALNPSNLAANVLSKFGSKNPAEINALNQVAGNLPVSLGDVIGSPALSSIYEKGLPKVVLSGVQKNQEKVMDATKDEANNLLTSLRGGVPEIDLMESVAGKISNNAKAVEEKAKGFYTEIDDMANKANITLNTKQNAQAIAKEYLEKHLKTIAEKGKSPLTDADVQTLNDVLADVPMSFGTAKQTGSTLGELSSKYSISNDKYLAGMYGKLNKSLNKDMEAAAIASGNKPLVDKLKETDKFFKEEVVPYRASDISQIVRGDRDLKTLYNTLMKTPNEKVLNSLDAETKKQLAFLHLKPNSMVKDNAQPAKLINFYNGLSKREKDLLFSREDQSKFDDLSKLTSLAKKPDNSDMSKYLKGAEATGLGVGAFAHLPATLAAGGLAIGGARTAANILSGPNIRQKVVNNLLRPQAPQPISNAISDPIRAMMLGGFAGYQPNQNNGVQ